jgi:hypothetical protein
MIEQKSVQTGDKTAPSTILEIRKKITDAVDATEGTAFKRLAIWLQMPTDSTFKVAIDRDCKVRADDVGDRLSSGGKAYKPASLAAVPDAKATWKSIDARLAAGQAVAIEGASSHVGGDKSYFVNKEKVGFHVIVFLATGADSDGASFYLGFDPDISATEESRTKWNELVSASTKIKELSDTDESTKILKAMLLGGSTDGFGPLIRKYYVDTTKKFPAIPRVFAELS